MEWKVAVICYLWIIICQMEMTNGDVYLSSNGSDYMNIGDSLELRCYSYYESKIDDVRFYRSTGLSDWIDITDTSSCIWTQSDLRYHYNVSCNGDEVYTVIKHNIQIDDHQSRWTCIVDYTDSAYNEVPEISNFFVVSVGVPVTTVQLAVSQVSGTTREFLCDTSPNGSRPQANFSWYKQRGHQSPELIEDFYITNERQTVSVPGQPQADLVISYSTLTLSADIYQGMSIYCTASNINNRGKDVPSTRVPANDEEKHSNLTMTIVAICVSIVCTILIILVIGLAVIIRRGRRSRSSANEAILEGHSNPISEQRTADEEQTNEEQDNSNSDQRPYTITTASDTTLKNYDRGTIDWYLKLLTHPYEEDNTP